MKNPFIYVYVIHMYIRVQFFVKTQGGYSSILKWGLSAV